MVGDYTTEGGEVIFETFWFFQRIGNSCIKKAFPGNKYGGIQL